MMRLILILFFFYSPFVIANTDYYYSTIQLASSACASDAGGSCTWGGYATDTNCSGGSGNSGKYTRGVSPNAFIYHGCMTGPACTNGFVTSPDTGSCVCPSGQVDDNGANSGGSCIDASAYPTCNYDQSLRSATNACPSGNEYTGWPEGYQCYEPSDGVITVPACTPTCGEGQYLTSGLQCANEPTCVGGQTLNPETHTCDEPVCVGDQVYDADLHFCSEPSCTGQQMVDLSSHTCVDPTCVGDQTPSADGHSCVDPVCNVGYSVNTITKVCEFTGCPAGFSSGQVNGQTQCVQSGQTTPGTVTTTTPTPVSSTTSPDGSTVTTIMSDGSIITTITTTNPDGSISTGTTTTPGPGGGTGQPTTEFELDTGGLAQESTQLTMLDELKKFNEGKAFAGGQGGSLYESSGKTYGGVLTAFKDRVSASPIASAGSGFFTITLSGACPIWTLPQTALTPAIPIDMQCSDMMQDIWPLISAVIIAAASFMAFKWAFL